MASPGSHQSASYGDSLRASVRQEGVAWYRRYMLSFAAAMFVLMLVIPLTQYFSWGWGLYWGLWTVGFVALGRQEFRQRVCPAGCIKSMRVIFTSIALVLILTLLAIALADDALVWVWAVGTGVAAALPPVYAARTAGYR